MITVHINKEFASIDEAREYLSDISYDISRGKTSYQNQWYLEGTYMEKCEKCNGEAEGNDGEVCSECKGEGEVEKSV